MSTRNLTQRVAANVKEAIRTANETPAGVSRVTGIHRATLVKRLTGNSPFKTDELDVLAEHFGTTADAFLREEVTAA